LNNHGTFVYISDVESTGMVFLSWAFLIGFALAAGIVPKPFVSTPPSSAPAPWLSPGFKTEEPSRRGRMVMVVSIFFFSLSSFLQGARSLNSRCPAALSSARKLSPLRSSHASRHRNLKDV
jgi:hypothetical protein